MGEPLRNVGAMTLFVEDLEGAKAFYGRVFRAPLVFEDRDSAVFNLGNMLVNLLRIPAARELIGPRAVAGPESGSRFQLTVEVEDVDEAVEDLGRHGVELLSGPVDRPWGLRTATFTDPAGHVWEIAQKVPGTTTKAPDADAPDPDAPEPGA